MITLKPWAIGAVVFFLCVGCFFAGWIAAPGIRERELIGIIGVSVAVVAILVIGFAGRDADAK